LRAVRWLVEADYGSPEEYPEIAVLRFGREAVPDHEGAPNKTGPWSVADHLP
jgi:hypothetical protein